MSIRRVTSFGVGILIATISFSSSLAAATQTGIASVYSDEQTANGEYAHASALTAAHRTLPFGTMVELDPGELVLRRGEQVGSSLFPVGSTMVTMVVDLGPSRSIEVASVGREGAVGGIVSCGHAPAFSRAEVLVPATRSGCR